MKRTGWKFGLSLAVFFGSFAATRLNGWLALGIPIGMVLSILYWFDLGREFRTAAPDHRILRAIGVLMGVPQAIFGVLCAGTGIVIIGWVLYNSFWHRDPYYTGGFMTFGVGPLLVLFGAGFAADAFRRSSSDET